MTASRRLSLDRIRSVRLGTVVKEFQISRSFLAPQHPQHTKNAHDKEIHSGTDRKSHQFSTMVDTSWSGTSSNLVLTEVRQYIGSIKQCECYCKLHSKGKGKAVPLRAWSGPEASKNLRFPDLMTTAQDDGKVFSLTHRPPLPLGNKPGTRFCDNYNSVTTRLVTERCNCSLPIVPIVYCLYTVHFHGHLTYKNFTL
jgi:hypothetical protein